MKRFLKVAHKIFTTIVTVLAAFGAVIALTFNVNKALTGYPSCLGYSVARVESGSMVASGLEVGGLYLIHETNDYQVGDIIVFWHGNNLWIHEIIDIPEPNTYQTKGSSNQVQDPFTVSKTMVVGEYTGVCLSGWIPLVPIILILVCWLLVILDCIREIQKIYEDDDAPPTHKKKLRRKKVLGMLPVLFLCGASALGLVGAKASVLQVSTASAVVTYVSPVTAPKVIFDALTQSGDAASDELLEAQYQYFVTGQYRNQTVTVYGTNVGMELINQVTGRPGAFAITHTVHTSGRRTYHSYTYYIYNGDTSKVSTNERVKVKVYTNNPTLTGNDYPYAANQRGWFTNPIELDTSAMVELSGTMTITRGGDYDYLNVNSFRQD